MSGVGSEHSATPVDTDDDQSPAAPLFPVFSQHLQAVERAGGGTVGGGSAVVAARRAALSSLWQWLRQATAGAEADEEAAARLRQLYRSITAEQVSLLCAIIRRAGVDGMENGVSQRRAARPAARSAAELERRKTRPTAVRGGWDELIQFHRMLLDAGWMARPSPAPASAARW